MTTKQNKISTQKMAMIGLMTAVTCILGPLSLPLPFSPVPISLTNLAVYLGLFILGTKWGTVSYLLYMLLGFVGVPVFSGFSGGPAKLLGPTGGYIIGFIFMALIGGVFIDKWRGKIVLPFIGLVLGTLAPYAFGTAWLAYQANMSFGAALMAGVIPFIPGDLAKMVIALIVGPQVYNALRKAGFNRD